MDAIKRAVIYARVSTDEQADKGYSIDTQLEACRRYAERLGMTVVAEFKEEFTGAIPIEQRPEGRKAYALMKSNQADAIIFYTVDRLVRPPEEGDEWDMPVLVRGLAKLGKEIHTCNRGQLKTDFASLLIAMLDAKGAGEERRQIIERTTRGRNGKARAGKVVGINRAPYGYRFVRDQNNTVIGLEVYKEEAGIVRLIFRWYLHGDGDGKPLTMRAIGRRLDEMTIRTPGREHYASRGARGVSSHSVIQTIIANETYAGAWHYGTHQGTLRRRAPANQHILVQVPEIVDRATWEAAQVQRRYNKKMSRRNAQHDYLLRGLIKCGCGRGMTGQCQGRWNFRRYICVGRGYSQPDCHEPSFSADRIERQIWEELRGFFRNLKRLERELRIAQQEELDAQEPKRNELEAVEENLQQVEREAAEIAATLPGARAKVKELLELRAEQVNTGYDSLMKRRAELQAALSARRLTDEAVGDILTYARDVREGLDAIEEKTCDARHRMLELLAVRITVRHGHYQAHCILGEWEGEIETGKRGRKSSLVTAISSVTGKTSTATCSRARRLLN